MTKRDSEVLLGFAVGTGAPVSVPLAHTFVTGQTQLSGKTTTLRAIVERSGRRALAFVTKRGETFDGRRIRPYLPREGDKQIPWRLVETIMAASLGQRHMKWERGAIVNASKGATTLAEVRRNVARLREKTKNAKTEELYMLLGEYLDLVLPEMAALHADDRLELAPGLNVMDLAGTGTQTQAMVIRAALEHINQHERDVLVVFPEAWEFAPRGRSAPAKDEAIAMARKGAVLGNFLLCDSQDIAGVDTVVRQAASVWILGVQRELNELKRTMQMIPAGIKRPKAEDVATLELGQFYACWGTHAVKVYVQPAGMSPGVAIGVARGSITGREAMRHYDPPSSSPNIQEDSVTHEEAARLERENAQLKTENTDLRRRIEALETKRHDETGTAAGRDHRAPARQDHAPNAHDGRAGQSAGVRPAAAAAPDRAARAFSVEESRDNEALYQAIKARLIDEAPALIQLLASQPEIEVTVTRKKLEFDEHSIKGRIAKLLKDGFFDEARGNGATRNALKRTGSDVNTANIGRVCDELVKDGFMTDEGSGYRAVAGMKVKVVEAA